MTMLNIWVDEKTALVAVDTAATFHGTQTVAARSKALPIPHMCAVIAARGDLQLLGAVFASISMTSEVFDDACDRMPSLIQAVCDGVKAQGMVFADVLTEILFVGWSNRQSRMIVCQFSGRLKDAGQFQVDILSRPYISPKAHYTEAPSRPRTPEEALAICTEHVTSSLSMYQMEFEAGEGTFGGELLTFDVSQGAIVFKRAGRLTP